MFDTTARYLDSTIVREAFPVLANHTYLNTGTFGIMPEPALQTYLEVTADFERGGVATRRNIGTSTTETRQRVAALVNADADEIAYTRNATDGINLCLAGFNWQPGDEIITSNEEHPAIAHPLAYLVRERKVRVRMVRVSPDPAIMLARLEQVFSPATRLVLMSHVTCETGTRLPAREICAWAAAHNIFTCFDGAQALGALPVDVRDMGADFYASNGHKWLCGPKGTGLFYCRKDRLDNLFMAHVGAGSLEKADLEGCICEPVAAASRFEFGTRSYTLAAGLGASLDWFEQLGWQNVHDHIASLARYAKQRILERPHLCLLTPLATEESSGLVSFVIEGKSAQDTANRLREDGRFAVRVVDHYNCIRLSTAHFNTEDDVDRLLKDVDALVSQQ
jgi:selenocysteine lyase/cysteine desulfurase